MQQVTVEREARTALRQATGTDTIPALVLEDGTSLIGDEAIRHFLEAHIAEPAEPIAAEVRERPAVVVARAANC